jgi:hypothetical protein
MGLLVADRQCHASTGVIKKLSIAPEVGPVVFISARPGSMIRGSTSAFIGLPDRKYSSACWITGAITIHPFPPVARRTCNFYKPLPQGLSSKRGPSRQMEADAPFRPLIRIAAEPTR